MPEWGGAGSEWGGEEIFWSAYGPPAPACPDDLLGIAAPKMLAYLPPYYECSDIVRALIQSEGYELDQAYAYATHVADIPILDEVSEWGLAMWEANLGIPGDRTAWTVAQRRAALLWFVPSPDIWLHQALPIREFVADQTLIDIGRISLAAGASYTYDWSVTAGTTDEFTTVGYWLRRVVPAHLALNQV